MKKYMEAKLFIFILFSVSTLTGQKANIKAVYGVQSIRDVQSIDGAEAQDLVYRSNDMLKSFEFELYANNNESLFKKTSSLIGDNDKQYIYNLALAFCDGEKIWYTNVKDDIQIALTESLEEPIILSIEQELEWQITGDVKTIGDYKVFKATSSRKQGKAIKPIIAWFSKDIPYNFGSLGVEGLPGLILELQIRDMVFTVKKLEKSTSKIQMPKGNGKLTYQEFYNRLDSEMESIMERGY